MTSFLSLTSITNDDKIQSLMKEYCALNALDNEKVSPTKVWEYLSSSILKPSDSFTELHLKLYNDIYKNTAIKPAWFPNTRSISHSNIKKVMDKLHISNYCDLYNYSINADTREYFYETVINDINITYRTLPTSTFNLSDGVARATYMPDAKLNIALSCFNNRDGNDVAIIHASESCPNIHKTMTFNELNILSNRVASSLTSKGFVVGDCIGMCSPMTAESVAIYLGIIKAGCTVVSIADSFSTIEIETRLRLSGAKAIFTQDVIYRGAKFLPLYERVAAAKPDRIFVLPGHLHEDNIGNKNEIHPSVSAIMRTDIDLSWSEFLIDSDKHFDVVIVDAHHPCNILFSSGTTGEPKCIVWHHSTAIKCAYDGYLHQDIHSGDVVCWPTNIGWMMGSWLIFQLINGGTLALFNGLTSNQVFCKFVEEANVTMLGVIPSLVKAWHANNTTVNCNWDKIRRFSSTGEASDSVSMLWLMSRVSGYAPVIEYCGGTEIGGSFLSSTVIQPNVPSMFSTPVLSSNLTILSDDGVEIDMGKHSNSNSIDGSSYSGEIALIPPALGLSTRLLHKDHYIVYYDNMPTSRKGEVLRRHGDEIEAVHAIEYTMPYYRALGRCDDTMNLGGIKVSSIEIERVCNAATTDVIQETAAIGASPGGGGPSVLIVFAVIKQCIDADTSVSMLKNAFQQAIKSNLNPLFQVHEVVVVDLLPRTASNKVMRRVLRDQYMSR